MSIICLICKDKLLLAPGSSLSPSSGSLNSLEENQVIATGCGHLYHLECLQCWFRTQKKKLQNQGLVIGDVPEAQECPTCQRAVKQQDIRPIFLLEDHRDSLEKAKLLEKMENLEIYCHQLEAHVSQLQRENDLLVNKVLTPTTGSHNPKRNLSAIVKNDRVVWMKRSYDNSPLTGIVISIFKKETSLWAKLKLDKKIRTNNNRSGLFGSFRFDKKQEITVPFEEIMLEKDYQRNNVIEEDSISTSSTPLSTPTSKFVPHRTPSFIRHSTLSLPGEYLTSQHSLNGNGKGLNPVHSFAGINDFGSTMSLQSANIASYLEAQAQYLPNQPQSASISSGMDKLDAFKFDQVRDYLILRQNSDNSQRSSSHSNGGGNEVEELVSSSLLNLPTSPTSPTFQSQQQQQQESKKHVTFADDLLSRSVQNSELLLPGMGNHFRDHDYKNVSEGGPIPIQLSNQEAIKDVQGNDSENSNNQVDMNLTGAHSQAPLELQYESPKMSNGGEPFNQSCFDITFATLFYKCSAFDHLLLERNAAPNDQIQNVVQTLLKNEFVGPLRTSQQYRVGYSPRLHETIAHLCSSCLDLEELMTILFEYVFKLPPFISYSYDMCDYIHQFFIDFTDKAKTPSVQQLLERSLSLQDNLKLRGEPSPALLLQMPNSEDGIIHYEAVIPSLTLNMEQLLEKDSDKTEALSCCCNKAATLECATCSRIHGKSSVLFCDECSVLLESIHDQMYHKLQLVPIKALSIPSTHFELGGVICLKGDTYSTFLRSISSNTSEEEEKWIHIDQFSLGKPKIVTLPKLERWIESINLNPSDLNLNCVNSFQRKLLTECRMFLYLPAQNSFA